MWCGSSTRWLPQVSCTVAASWQLRGAARRETTRGTIRARRGWCARSSMLCGTMEDTTAYVAVSRGGTWGAGRKGRIERMDKAVDEEEEMRPVPAAAALRWRRGWCYSQTATSRGARLRR